MKDPVKTPDLASGNKSRRTWLWIIVLAMVVAALALWLNGSQDIAAPTANLQGNNVDAISDTTPVPTRDADPNPVVPQDALIPPAPITPTPEQ
jgi:hypothetical protein